MTAYTFVFLFVVLRFSSDGNNVQPLSFFCSAQFWPFSSANCLRNSSSILHDSENDVDKISLDMAIVPDVGLD